MFIMLLVMAVVAAVEAALANVVSPDNVESTSINGLLSDRVGNGHLQALKSEHNLSTYDGVYDVNQFHVHKITRRAVEQGSNVDKNGKPCVVYNGTPAACDYHGSVYKAIWCYTSDDGVWDYCSKYKGRDVDMYGRVCVPYKGIDECGYHGKSYVWCYSLETLRRKECSISIRKTCVAYGGAPAACGYHGESYIWCYTTDNGKWDYCSKYHGRDLEKNGKPCVPYRGIPAECGNHGESYVWCYTSYGGDWDKCSDNRETRPCDSCSLYSSSPPTKIQQIKDIEGGLISGTECSWDTDCETPEYPPIIMNSRTNEIILPELKRNYMYNEKYYIASVAPGTRLLLFCPGHENKFRNGDAVHIYLNCNNGILQTDSLQTVQSMKELGCFNKVEPFIYPLPRYPCGENNVDERFKIAFGIQLPDVQMIHPEITVCFSKKRKTTLWTENKIYSKSIAAQKTERIDKWKYEDNLFSVNKVKMDLLYQQKQEHALFQKKNIDLTIRGQEYFAKGHLSSRRDFVSQTGSDASFNYVNALPQWQAFNNGNWKILEGNIENLAGRLSGNLRIITGGYETLKLVDRNGAQVPIYLGETPSVSVTEAVPVPEYIWKIVVDDARRQAAAFVITNNPQQNSYKFLPSCNPSDVNCNALGDWITFNRNDQKGGFIYCCTINTLIKDVKDAPKDLPWNYGPLTKP